MFAIFPTQENTIVQIFTIQYNIIVSVCIGFLAQIYNQCSQYVTQEGEKRTC